VAKLAELTRPVVRTGTGFHTHQARRQRGDEFEPFGTRDSGPDQSGLARFIHAVNSKDVLRQINAKGYDSHDASPSTKRVS